MRPQCMHAVVDVATQVVTPFTPTDWRMTYDGATVSLHPSVGNWNQRCRSHYVISKWKSH
ncbi:DUF6527 family protein [Cupriavidus basilensis]